MTDEQYIARLESEYDRSTGFFGRLRDGTFDQVGAERVVQLLMNLDLAEGPTINRRIVELLWMIPTLVQYQVDRGIAQGVDVTRLRRFGSQIDGSLQRLLGLP